MNKLHVVEISQATWRTSMRVFILVVSVFVSQSSAAQHLHPGDWMEIRSSEPGRNLFLNVKTIVNDGAYRKAWTLSTWEQVQTVSGVSFQSVLQVDLYDCNRRTLATRLMQVYEGGLATGKVTRTIETDHKDLKWREIPPGAPIEDSLRLVCQAPLKE